MENILNHSCYNLKTDTEKINYIYNFLTDFYSSVEFILLVISIIILFILYISLDSYFYIRMLKKKNEN